MPPVDSPCELTLQCKPSGQTPASVVGDEKQRLEEYLQGLTDERLKIEAFQRQLPFSMQLLNDVIEASQRQLGNYENLKYLRKEEENELKPFLGQFTPVRKSCLEAHAKDDMPNWMSSVGLWSQDNETKQTVVEQQDSKNRDGRAFLPFSNEKQGNPSPGLSGGSHPSSCNVRAVSFNNKSDDYGYNDTLEETRDEKGIPNGTNTNPNDCQSTQRKGRRCWSPELHQKFVDALQQLGGSQATPKQIRDLMKVEGLTNDEVKSHLQKYRQHSRRGRQSTAPSAQLVLVGVGGIWVPPAHYASLPTMHYSGQPPAFGGDNLNYWHRNTSSYEYPQQPQLLAVGDYNAKSSDQEEMEKSNGEKIRKYGRELSLHLCGRREEEEKDGRIDSKRTQTTLKI